MGSFSLFFNLFVFEIWNYKCNGCIFVEQMTNDMKTHCISVHGVSHEMELCQSDLVGFDLNKLITMKHEPKNIIDIPMISQSMYNVNQKKYEANYRSFYGSCACCGKGIKEPKFLINTIYGGLMYPADDTNVYRDAWTMPVGNECVKKVPTEYIIIKGA